jgi:hypothetical protein
VLDGGRLRVIPSARLDPCVCDAGSAGITEVVVVDVELELEVVVVVVQRRESGGLEVVTARVGPLLDDSAAAATGGGGDGSGLTNTRIAVDASGVGAGRTGAGEGGSSRFWGEWEWYLV